MNPLTWLRKAASAVGIVLAMVMLFAAASCDAQDSWTGPDKPKHFAFSCLFGLGASKAVDNPFRAFALATLPGLAKELMDRKSSGFSHKDLAVDAIGAGACVAAGRWLVRHSDGRTTVGRSWPLN